MFNELFSRRNIAKLALEGAVVVISILIAFALDAWWNDRQLQHAPILIVGQQIVA